MDDSCGPFFPDGCFGASNHSTSGSSGGRHELVVVDPVLLDGDVVELHVPRDVNALGRYAQLDEALLVQR